MKTILACVLSILLTNTFCVRLRLKGVGDQVGCQKGVNACQSVGVSQCGVSQCTKGIGAGVIAAPLTCGGIGWAGNSYPWGGQAMATDWVTGVSDHAESDSYLTESQLARALDAELDRALAKALENNQ